MKKWLLNPAVLISALLLVTFVVIRIYIFDIAYEATHAFEEERFCEALEKALVVSPYTNETTLIVGMSYAGGFCVQQNLDEANKWFLISTKGSSERVPGLFFYSATTLFNVYEGGPKDAEIRNRIVNAFQKSLEMGFVPTEKDIKDLDGGETFLNEAKSRIQKK